jgi:DNA-3-methyladenine glycosylase
MLETAKRVGRLTRLVGPAGTRKLSERYSKVDTRDRQGSGHLDLASLRAERVPRTWYKRDALVIARALIGCLLVHERGDARTSRVARIVETEAYRGPEDLACHARVGLTKRTRSLLGEEGHAYVFLVYGMHHCFNVTCRGAGHGHAVLVRAGEPVWGIEPRARLDGPGRFARAMEITRALDDTDLTGSTLYVCSRPVKRVRLATSARVGVAYAGAWADEPWRFFEANSAHVSKPTQKAIGRPRSLR